MFDFLKRKKLNIRQQYDIIIEIYPLIRYHIYLELRQYYEKEIDSESAGVLAVQVVNHLMGDDFEKGYDSATPDLKEKINEIKDLIEFKCDEAMTNNKVVRELVIRFIMTTSIIYHCLFDKTFFDSPETRNREELIRKYGSPDPNDIPESTSFDRLVVFAKNFIEESQKALNAKKS
ncbi:hypothetical protein [Clostridium sp.]|uniref:hypothetical protein n=1 Tax=Clostridium sp. TaxID=1506 RepID=UPI002844BA88|nr:hypothetical protein [Clostridium sp.]MDR3597990.1 hypothetical protein [Clostridium sp.]MDR3666557.1 hypothetical protein [Ignavibacteriaceae bacterium]